MSELDTVIGNEIRYVAHAQSFKNEKEFQIFLARKLISIGFKVYTDKKIADDLPVFKGDREKPDLLLFFNKCYKDSKVIKNISPIAIEIKFTSDNNKFNVVSKSILQIKKYYGKQYRTDNWSGEIKNLYLTTDDLIFKNKVYEWSPVSDDKSFHDGMRWTLLRVLGNISNQAGFLCYDRSSDIFFLETPNSDFYLLNGGDLGYKPNRFNNNGMGYHNFS